jgi:phenylacetate-CoA ligase
MKVKNYYTENIVLPLSDLITGQSVTKYFRFLQNSQWWSTEKLREFQEKRLRQLIKHSVESVPYYRELFINYNIKIDDIRNIEDLKKIPILNKKTIKKEGVERFKSTAYPENHSVKMSSSGSTGEPLFYLTTKEAYSVNIASNLRGWYWMGYRLADKYIKLSQNPRKNPIKRLQDYFSNNLYLATNPLIDSNFEHILRQIERYQPKVIRCYPDPLLFLARYKKHNPHFAYSPLAITTTGNTLFPETRNEIEEAFGCKIFDSYSCEGNSTVFECPNHSCYHSTEEYGISEIIDEFGNPVTKGIGKLISTDLWNLKHPFIRYDTQDYVEVDNEPCLCGREHLRILRILGRDNDVLVMPNGRRFIVHNFTGFFQTDIPEINSSIDQFQVVKTNNEVIFKLVVNRSYNRDVAEFIKNYWTSELQFDVKIEIVPSIPLTKSGKRRFIFHEGTF